MRRSILVVTIMLLVMAAYNSPGIRGKLNLQYSEARIESQCDAIAECRNVEGNLDCWYVTDSDEIRKWRLSTDVTVRPEWYQFDGICADIELERQAV